MNSLVETFNCYVEKGGEELIADAIRDLLQSRYQLSSLRWDSSQWKGKLAPNKLRQLLMMFYNRDAARELEAVVNTSRPRAILAHNLYPVASPSVYRRAQRLGIPVIQFIHNFRPFSVNGTLWANESIVPDGLAGDYWPEVRAGAWQGSLVKSAILAGVLKLHKSLGTFDAVTRWIAISDFMRDAFIEAGVPAERVVTLRHFWNPVPKVPETKDDGYYLFLSRLVPEKGVRVLLEAWARLYGSLRQHCPKLCIAGTGPLESEVQAAAENCAAIEYAGYVSGDAKARLMHRARAFIAPSIWWEPLGLVTYEAYEHGKPMLASNSGGFRETVQDGRTGLLFEPGSPESLMQAVRTMELTPAEQRLQMGRCGHHWLLEEASREQWLQRFSTILDEVA
ncbi:glycosyltransferase family 4 protein [Coraliomargarita parva]|uniref:glycosyltransferase family 4 protein n=1 Tax=Coraliomargarita parva TaxID=3014050 RepID=UPI0022B440CB|nr:glycosyltransferase family 4 protein [Coraliomargarita parva]